MQPVVETDERRGGAGCFAGAMERQVLAAETGADGAVVQDRHIGERLHDLMGAGDAVPRHHERSLAGDVGAVKDNAFGVNTPLIRLNKVDLPAPFGPISPRISPSRMAKDRLCTARSPPKRLLTRSSSSSAVIPAPFAGAGSGYRGSPSGRTEKTAR